MEDKGKIYSTKPAENIPPEETEEHSDSNEQKKDEE